MSIWKKDFTLEDINKKRENTLAQVLGIEFVEVGDDYIIATMPVDSRTHQPMGILHGGASVALAESVGSLAATLAVEDGTVCVGLEINANHIKSIASGKVIAKTTPIHIGRRTQVWAIEIKNEDDRLISTSRITLANLTQ